MSHRNARLTVHGRRILVERAPDTRPAPRTPHPPTRRTATTARVRRHTRPPRSGGDQPRAPGNSAGPTPPWSPAVAAG
ncbi:hypothetical protein DVA86_25280 [Streptomyces armeniacus]|uniref:Uncharacterized protein n=1 Tax=Streptomyces armeniacus TaxID=83291 RepID=A0A345XV02_9ACTN|nr:hypothetical protein DVA86_25280 [Streptomyces armeniacus]